MLGECTVTPMSHTNQDTPEFTQLKGPTDDDYETDTVGGSTAVDAAVYPYNLGAELSDLAETLCESDVDVPPAPDPPPEALNGESFILHGDEMCLHGELTVATAESPDDNSSQSSRDVQPAPKPDNSQTFYSAPTRISNIFNLNRIKPANAVARIIETCTPTQTQPGLMRRHKSIGKNTKSPNSTAPAPTPPSFIDLTLPKQIQKKVQFSFSSQNTRKQPPNPNSHFYGGKRQQHINNTHTTSSDPSPTKAKTGAAAVRAKTVISLDDNDIFEYTPRTPASSSSPEKLIKNEDRYSKYELARLANEKHKKLHEKNLKLNEKVRVMKEYEKKMLKMKSVIEQLKQETSVKDAVLEKKSKDLMDLESTKADNEIFIQKLKTDIGASKQQLQAKDNDLNVSQQETEKQMVLLKEQKRLHKNLSNAHNTTLRKIKTLTDENKKASTQHHTQLIEKDLQIQKLDLIVQQKSDTISDLIKDKCYSQETISETRKELQSYKVLVSAKDLKLELCTDQIKSLRERLAVLCEIGPKPSEKKPSIPKPVFKPIESPHAPLPIKSETPELRSMPLLPKTPELRSMPLLPKTPMDPPVRVTPIRSSKRRVKRSSSVCTSTVSTPTSALLPSRKRAKSAIHIRSSEILERSKRRRTPSKRYSPTGEPGPAGTPLNLKTRKRVCVEKSVPKPTEPQDVKVEETDTTETKNRPFSPKTASSEKADTEKADCKSEQKTPDLEQPESQPDAGVAEEEEEEVQVVEENLPKLCRKVLSPQEYFVTHLEYVPDRPHPQLDTSTRSCDLDTSEESLAAAAANIEIPSYRDISPLMLIHEEGVQGQRSKCNEAGKIENYSKMHKKCEVAEVRMMKQCEKMRKKLELKDKRRKLKNPEPPRIDGSFYCKSKDHDFLLTKSTYACVSAFRTPLLAVKQMDFSLPWSGEIKSFAYVPKSSKADNFKPENPPVLTNLPLTDLSQPPTSPNPPLTDLSQPPTSPNPHITPQDLQSQITLIFSNSTNGIVLKTQDVRGCTANQTIEQASDSSLISPTRIAVVSDKHTPLSGHSQHPLESPKSNLGNLWSGLNRELSKVNLFSKLQDISKSVASTPKAITPIPSNTTDTATEHRSPRPSTSSSETSNSSKFSVEKRNIWADWLPSRRTDINSDKTLSGAMSPLCSHRKTLDSRTSTPESGDISSEPDPTEGPLEPFDQKSFLLEGISAKPDKSPNLPAQPLTKKLEKLSKHMKPRVLCTNSPVFEEGQILADKSADKPADKS